MGQAKYPITHDYADFEDFYSKNETQTNDIQPLTDTQFEKIPTQSNASSCSKKPQ